MEHETSFATEFLPLYETLTASSCLFCWEPHIVLCIAEGSVSLAAKNLASVGENLLSVDNKSGVNDTKA
jgi:hypothetical protein